MKKKINRKSNSLLAIVNKHTFLEYGEDSVLNSMDMPLATSHHESMANEVAKTKLSEEKFAGLELKNN